MLRILFSQNEIDFKKEILRQAFAASFCKKLSSTIHLKGRKAESKTERIFRNIFEKISYTEKLQDWNPQGDL